MAHTKQTAHKTPQTKGLVTYEGGQVHSSSDEMASSPSETQGETAPMQRESNEVPEQPRQSKKRKWSDRTASSSLQSANHTRKSRKVVIEYMTDETDEGKIPEMGDDMSFPKKTKRIKLTLPATPLQVHLARTFVEWFSYHGMRPGMMAALESRGWNEENIDEFVENFCRKHGFNRHTAVLPYPNEGDSENEQIQLEGGRRVVLQRRIISPRESSTQEDDPDKLDNLVSKPKKRSAPQPAEEETSGEPPVKKKKKEKKPAKDPKPKKPKKPKRKKGEVTGEPPRHWGQNLHQARL